MDEFVIRAENVSKRYHIGRSQKKIRRLREATAQTVAAPFRRIYKLIKRKTWSASELDVPFWALRDVSFSVQRGDILGIVGQNGSGKTTLLKMISGIVRPTNGIIRVRGRTSTLLGVGAGFHDELTGRENVFLNGVIMGMTRKEIEHKFDEIVAFSETEKFIDSPIKHFSRGMNARLAFSIAAHLESDILLLDEVLAVGDVAFRKKCLLKINDIVMTGRTVLFVSHSIAAVRQFCSRAILLESGKLILDSSVDEVMDMYLKDIGPIQKGGKINKLIDELF